MICCNCNTERLVSDFINNQKFCYQCMYRINQEKMKKKRTKKIYYCRTCGNQFEQNSNLKKRQRTVFCSSECAGHGHKKQLNNHWTRRISNGDSWHWKGKSKWTISRI